MPVSEPFRWTTKQTMKVVVALVLMLACICGPPNKWLWWQAWFVIAAQVLVYAVAGLYIMRHNPGLFAERERFITNEGTAGFDKILATLIVAIAYPLYIAAGFQHRYQPQSTASITLLQTATAVLVDVLSISLQCWAMCENHWYSSVVRIQTDRGHKVCSTGPYAVVRHPGYVSVLTQHLAEAVLLHSTWLLIVGLVRAVLLLVRTVLEEALLLQQLPGYKVYAAKVKCRWMPYVW